MQEEGQGGLGRGAAWTTRYAQGEGQGGLGRGAAWTARYAPARLHGRSEHCRAVDGPASAKARTTERALLREGGRGEVAGVESG